MNLPKLSIKQTTMMVSVMIAIIAIGIAAFKAMSVDLFADAKVPVISVVTVYPGAGPAEIETLVSRPLEEEISAVAGIKRLSSRSFEGVAQVVAEFRQGVTPERAEQLVRDKVNIARAKMPKDVEEPIIRRFDPSDTPVVTAVLTGDLDAAKLYDLADRMVKPRFEQVNNVSAIEISGGRKREIHVLLDRAKLKSRELSVSHVAAQLAASGENIPSGKVTLGTKELVFRGLGEFESVPQIADTMVNLYGNEVPTRIGDVGTVTDALQDEKNRAYIDGRPAISFSIYRQSGTNTLEVVDAIKVQLDKINSELVSMPGNCQLQVVVDGSTFIRENVRDVYETIVIAVILTVFTVLLFLGSVRSTLITSLSLPISLFGSFAGMYLMGFSINVVTLIALSLAVGLLVDDAIVVIENIHRRIDEGETPLAAAVNGTGEIQMSIIAISLVVIGIFIPVAFLGGVVGQFLKQFGLTIAISMAISLFVALTLMPMMAGYFTSAHKGSEKRGVGAVIFGAFNRAYAYVERGYGWLLARSLRWPLMTLTVALAIVALSIFVASRVPSAFMPEIDSGEILVALELPPGDGLEGVQAKAFAMEKSIKSNPDVELTFVTIGGRNGEANKGEIFVKLKKPRSATTNATKQKLREVLVPYADARPIVKDYDPSGLINLPVNLNLVGTDQAQLESYANALVEHLRQDPRLRDLDSTSRPGKPEIQFKLSPEAANTYGINSRTMGAELRGQVEGMTPAKFRENGREYDIRVRLLPEQRDLKENYRQIYIPNINRKLIRLSDVATAEETTGAAVISRLDRGRYVQITAGLAPGVGLSDVTDEINRYLTSGETKLPPGMRYNWGGDTESMNEMMSSATLAFGFAFLIIYLILASLYHSFVTPLTILVSIPLAVSGAFFALYLTGNFMNIFAVLGMCLLVGVASKNAILLVDFANQGIARGLDRNEAMFEAGMARLRPILMTSFALIAGTLPVAIAISEVARMRTAMGWAIIGGLISSTLLTLIVVPAIFSFIDRFRVWSKAKMAAIFLPHDDGIHAAVENAERADDHMEIVGRK